MSAHKLFGVFAGVYPAQPATAFWRAIEMKVLADRGIPAGRGLDLGCGDGILTDVLLDEVGQRDLVGIDLDPLETTAARRYPFYSAVHTCSADAIPEPAASFDFVVSNSVLEHVPPLEGAIAEVARLLKKGGRFFFTVPGPAFHDNLAGSVLPWVSRERYLTELDARLAHFHYLSPDDWRQLLARHGLVLDHCDGYLTRAQTRRWEILSKMTGGLLYTLFGKARRPIEIQRTLGARALQNRMHLPRPLATFLGRVIRFGVRVDMPALGVAGVSCLMVEGHRP